MVAHGLASSPRVEWRHPIVARSALALVLAAASFALIGLPAGLNPVVVIGATAGAVFAVLVLSDVTIGLMCFGVVAFFEVLPGVSGTVSAAKVAGTLVALSWLATIAVRSQVRRGFFAEYPVASYGALLFVAWMVLSLTWAQSTSAGVTVISRYALNLMLLPIAFAAIRTRRHALVLVGILVAGATLSAFYGVVFARGAALAEGTSRLSGAGSDSDYLASVLVSGIVLAVALVSIRTIPPAVRALCACAGVLEVVALVSTVSRGGMVGLGAALIAGVFLAGRGRRLLWASIAVLLALSIVGYYASVASPAARARITSLNNGGSGREDIWSVGWRMVQAHPVVGIGVGNFSHRTKDFLIQPGAVKRSKFIIDVPKVAHNIYLEILAELGIIGLAMFLGILAFLLSCGVRAARAFRRIGDLPLEVLSRAVVIATIGILATDFFLSDQYSKPLWIQLAICPALLALARREQRVGLQSEDRSSNDAANRLP